MVGLVLGEAEGEVLDAVDHAESFEEQDELTQFFNEPVLIFGRCGSDEHQHVVRQVVETVGIREDDERWCEYRIFREETCAVGVILIAEFCCRSIVVSARYFSMSAKAALRRGSLTTERSVGGSAFGVTVVDGIALRPNMDFTRESSWLRLLAFWRSVLMALPPRSGLYPTCASS